MITELVPDRRQVEISAPASAPARSTFRTLTPAYWRFLSASVFFDFGFGLFFFIFNLYLAAAGFNESRIGFFTSSFTLGSLAATWPAGLIARRYGLRPLLVLCMIVAPAAGALRTFALAPASQAAASCLFGIAMCGWAICTPTALARLTDNRNRSLGFSINFGVGIGSGVLAGVLGGRLPMHFAAAIPGFTPADGMRFTLLLACALVTLGAIPLARTTVIAAQDRRPQTLPGSSPTGRRFLLSFLAAFALWSSIAAAFSPFANIYMVRHLGITLPRMGEIFAASQFLQVLAVISTPVLHRWFGAKRTIIAIQLSAAAMLLLLARTVATSAVMVEFVLLNALLYMAGPSIYALLMTATPDPDRSIASAAQSLTSSFVGVASAALAGLVAVRYGYPPLFSGLASVAVGAAILFFCFL